MIRKTIVFISAVTLVSSLMISTASATNTSSFRAGDIIDDAIFTNTNSMTVAGIQNFLNSKVPSCDTNQAGYTGGTGTVYSPPWICLKDFYEVSYSPDFSTPPPSYTVSFNYLAVVYNPDGSIAYNPDRTVSCSTQTGSRSYLYNNDYKYTSLAPVYNRYNSNGTVDCSAGYGLKATIQSLGGTMPTNVPSGSPSPLSAAQIIYNTAQHYRINPQVLIVLLQKEQGLVTDTWPVSWEYQSATGYGCPDYAQCSAGDSGFSNQVKWAATMYKSILDNSPTWYSPYVIGNNTILYNPNRSCGSSNVYIQNRSTQALYDYTPYQPNAAALAAGYGSGDSCSSHGNLNFWLYFNDWFGSTTYSFGNTPSGMSNYAQSPCTIPTFSNTYVGRLYNPDRRDYLLTASSSEACAAVKLGYIWDGVVMKSTPQGTTSTPVYRLNSPFGHAYTADQSSRQTLLSQGYTDEGVLMYGYTSSQTSTLPVYSLTNIGTNLLVSAGAEGAYDVNSLGFTSNGVAFYTPVLDTPQQPVYRLKDGSNQRFYTINQQEESTAQQAGYSLEGTVSNDDTLPDQSNLPVYRLVGSGGHFYTTDRNERDLAVVNYGFLSEGIGWYTPDSSYQNANPIYRQTNYHTGNLRLYTGSLVEHNNARTYYGYTDEGVGWYGY